MTTSKYHNGSNTNTTSKSRDAQARRVKGAGWLFLCASLHLMLAPAFAGSLYWDLNGTTAGAGLGGAPGGAWDTTSLNWTLSGLGTATTVAWTNGETAVFSAGTDATGSYPVTLGGGLTAAGVTVQEGTVALSGSALTLSGSGVVSVSLAAKAVIASQVSGTVGLTKASDGELVLEGGNDFTGGLTLQLGTLTLDNDSAANSGNISIANSGGPVTLRTTKSLTTLANNLNLGTANGNAVNIAADSGKQLVLNGVISGSHSWVANGAGAIVLGGASDNTFPGAVTVAQGTLIVAKNQALGTTLNGTTINSGASLAFHGGFEYQDNELVKINGNGFGGSGAINNLGGDNLFDGTVTLESASSIGATAQGVGFVGPVSGSFALTKVGTGYVDLYAEDNNYTTTLVSQGTLGVWYPANAGTGLATVSAGARLEGNGSVPGGITLSGTISPGASPDSLDSGSQTWNGAATYEWELKTASGTAGLGWDLLNITGGLSIGATPSSKFKLKIISLAPDNSAGDVSDFDNTQEYNWTIAATTTGVTSFDADAFTLDDSAFNNAKGGGKFVILQNGNNLVLRFDPKPGISCPANIAQANDPNVCGASIPFAPTATDNDTITPPVLTYKIGSTPITSPHMFLVGTTIVDATATDSVGNTDTCSFTVTVTDAQAPVIAGTPANITVQTGAGRATCDQVATWTAPTASDNCAVASLTSDYGSGATFPVGTTTVTYTAKDAADNTTTATFTVTVQDTTVPAIAGMPANITVQTGAGRTSCDQVATWTAPTASDNCAVASLTSDYSSGATFPVGTTTVTYTAKDAADNTTTATFTVTVQDNTVPVAVAKNITRSLALNGTVSITAAEVNDASTDNCHIASLSVAPNTWSCTVGDKAVTLTVTDDAGNVSTTAATVTITTPPYAPAPHFGQPDVALANAKTDTNTAVTLNVGQNLGNSLAKTIAIGVAAGFQFGEPAGVGAGVEVGYGGYPGSTNRFRVRTTATQNEWEIYDTQNSAVAMFVHVVPDTSLTVEVNPATMPGCLEQYTWDLAVTIRGSIPQGTIFKTASVCGAHTFPMTFTSYFDQVLSRTGSVTLDDGTAPIALCQPKTLALDSAGHATLNASDIDNSSTDNCTAPAGLVKELSKDGSTGWATSLTYDCGERGGNTVTLRIKDAAGNASTCTASVTVQDNINPVAQCQPATIQLDAGGAATLTVADIENGSTDNCAVTVRELSKDGVSGWDTSLTYACGERGANTVTLRVKDAAGNEHTATATVTVQDNINPVALPKPAALALDNNGSATLNAADIENGSTDNCAVTVWELSKNGSTGWASSLTYACGELGPNTVTLRVKDAAGNSATATATVTVSDLTPPTVISQNISVNLDADGRATITPAQVNNGSTDNCGTVNLVSVVPSSFTFCNVGPNLVTLTVNDGHGNSAQATPTVTVNAPASTLAGEVWTPRDSNRGWYNLASSADGSKLVAQAASGLFTSSDAGTTWTQLPGAPLGCVASSADGTKLVAGVYNGRLYTSTDSGSTWTARENIRIWTSVASSADGTKLAAVCVGNIYTSTDSGQTWVARANFSYWSDIASSADGTKLAAVGDYVWTSTDSGVTWTRRGNWHAYSSVASSADGTKLVATENTDYGGGRIYTSTDSGVTWTTRMTDVYRNWRDLASSADGTKLVAGVRNGRIYTSTDSGVTWTPRESNRDWTGIASSADGTKLFAAVWQGQIYTSQTIIVPSVVYVDDDYGTTCAEVTFPATGGTGQYYVGYNAFKTVQAAINAVATGGTVRVAAGTYAERPNISKSVTLLGAQAGVDPTPGGARANPAVESIITETGLSTPNPDVVIEIPNGVNNVVIDGFTLNGDQLNTTADTSVIRCWGNGAVVRNNIVDGMQDVIFKGGTGFTLDHNRVLANKNGFVAQPGAASNVLITGNIFTPGTALQTDPSAINLTTVTGGVVSSNTASGWIVGATGRALAGSGVNNLSVFANAFTGNRDAISIFGGSTFIAITNNVLTGSARFGINIKGQDVQITGNVISGSGTAGVSVDRHLIDTLRVSLGQNDLSGSPSGLIVISAQDTVNAINNWWGDLSGPASASLNFYGTGSAISGNATFSPWLANGTDTSVAIGFQPAAGVNYQPTHLEFATQPVGAALGNPLATQPVVQVRDVNENVTPWAQPDVALVIGFNPGDGVLTGTIPKPATLGVATFTDLAITVGGGSDYTLVASAPSLTSATSDPFNVANSSPAIANLSPFWIRTGSADFTLEVAGTGFVPNSKIHWNGVERTTAFVSATKLTTLIAAAEIVTPASVPVKVVTPTPGGGTTAELTFRIEGATPTVVYVDDGYGTLPNDTLVDWPHTSSGSHIIGYNAFDTVQEGVNAVAANGVVNVAAGTYLEAVEVSGNLTVRGAGAGTIVKGPASISQSFTFTGWNGLDWEYHPVIWVHGTDNVTIEDLVVDGDKQGGAYVPSGSISARYTGVAFDDAGGTIEDVEIKNVMAATLDGGGHHGLIAHGDANDNTLVVNRVNIHDFGKAGAFFSAVNNSTGGLDVTVTGCTVTGAGATTSLAQNGIEIEEGATGTISGNTVSEIGWIGSGWTGTGIAAVYCGAVTVSGNTLNNAQSGLALWGAADGSSVAGNTIGANNLVGPTSDIGILLLEVGDVTIGAGNTIDGTGYGWGLYLQDVLATSPLSLSDLAFANFASGDFITLDGIVPALDATGVSFEGKTGSTMTLAEGFAAEDRITHQLDDASLELVRWKAGNLYVTTSSGSIQRAVDAATVGDTINVAAGTFTEGATVPKQVAILGSGSGVSGTIISTTGRAGFSVTGSGVIGSPLLIKGVRVSAAANYGVALDGASMEYVRLENCHLAPGGSPSRVGVRIGSAGNLRHAAFVGLSFAGNLQDVYFANDTLANASVADDILFDRCTFSATQKGIYVEKLSNATIKCCTFNQVGSDIAYAWSGAIDINLKWADYANITIEDCNFVDCGVASKEGAALAIKARGTGLDSGYSARPATLAGVLVKGCVISGNERGIRLGEPAKNNTGPTGVVVQGCSITGNVKRYAGVDGSAYGGLVNMMTGYALAKNNWWGSASGPARAANPGGNGDALFGSADYSPWLGAFTDLASSCGGFQPDPLTPVHYAPHHLLFSTQPGGAGINAPLAPQPVVQVIDEHNGLATVFNGSVTLAINTGTAGATLSTTLTQPVFGGVATFSGLQIDRAGTYTLSAVSASPIVSATSSSFDIANSLPSIASLSPPWAVAGDAGFTLTVNGADFVYNSVVRWNGSDRATTFVNSGQLTATITAADIAAIGTASVTVFNVAPGGGESTPATSFEIKSVPTVVWVDDSFTSGSSGGHLWGYDAFTAIQAGVNRVDTSGTVNVAAGSYVEAVNANKPVTLLGADSASPCGGSQSVINGGAGTAVTINAVNVTVKGFELQGVTGVSDAGFSGAVVQNNKVTAVVQGVAMQGIAGAFTVKDNCVNLPGAKDVSGNPTIGIVLASLSGGGQVMDGNKVSGPLYGYLLADVDAASPVTVQGGTITGVMQGVAVINYDLLFAQKNSTFKVDGVSMSGFTGASANPARNFHAGVYVYTGGADTSATVVGTVTDVTVDGTGKISADSAGLSFADFSTGIGTRQNITVVNCTIQNNLNRGINVRSSNAVVSVTGSTLTANGRDPFGLDDNDGFGIIARDGAQVSVSQCFITNPASQVGSYPVAALVTSAEGVMPGGTITANNCSIDNNGNTSGKLARNLLGTLDASGNWWGGTDEATIALAITGVVDFTPYLNVGTDISTGIVGFQGDFSTLNVTALGAQSGSAGRVQEGHNLATTGGTVSVEAGTYIEVGQVVISKDLSIVGADKLTTIIRPDSDTGTDGDARGWFLVGAGKSFNLQKVTLDGTGHQVYHGLRHHGSGLISDCAFAGIRHGVFEGTAIAAYGPGNIDVTGCTFAIIGRNGVATYDAPTGTYSGNTYTGKGAGNWMDYAFLIQWGANVTVQNNVISDCVGVYTQGASSWGSSGIAVWDDPETTATLTGNTLANNSVGLAIAVLSGYSWGAGLDPQVHIGDGNIFTGGEIGMDVEKVRAGAEANPLLTFGASTFKGQTVQAITLQTDMSTGSPYDISSVIFKDNADVVITDNFAKEDLVYHVVDAYDRGLLVWNASKDYVTPLSASIQRGVDAASAGWTVNVKSGSYTENVNVNKALAVSLGASPAQVIVNGDWAMTGGSSLVMELNGTVPGTGHDQLVVNGTVDLGGATLSASSDVSYAAGANVILIANDGSDEVTGTFAGLASGSTLTLGGQEFTIYYNGGDGNDVVLFRSGDLGTFATVYVDDTFPNAVPGQDPDGGGSAHYFMYDSFPTVQGGVNAVNSGGTVNVAAGSYPENVNVNKAVTLKGANFGVSGCGSRGLESTITNTSGIALNITVNDVVVDGFDIQGSTTGIQAQGVKGFTLQNNLISGVKYGVDIGNVVGTGTPAFTVQHNKVVAGPDAGSGAADGTAAVLLTDISGTAPVIQNNCVSGSPTATVGYFLYKVAGVTIQGGTISTVMQGVTVVNLNPVTGADYFPSTFTVDGVTMSAFAGASLYTGRNVQAGVLVATAGPVATDSITGTIKNVDIQGVGKLSSGSAGVQLNDSSTGTGVRQLITIQDSVVSNNKNRGVHVLGSHVTATVTRCQINGNGGDPFGANDGYGIRASTGATLSLSESYVANPGTVSSGTPRALYSSGGAILTASGNSVSAGAGKLAERYGTSTLNASGNWLGANVEATVVAGIIGSVDFTPYLDSATDTSVTAGFQGDFSTLHATMLGSQTGSSGRVQEAIGAVTSGGNVMVEAGTYAEHVAVNKQVTLAGASPATTTINGGGSGVVVLVTVANSTVTGFTVTGSGSTALDGGIGLVNVTGCSVSNNIVNANAAGIGVVGGSGNQVAGNQVSGNYIGITLENRAAFGGTVNDGATGNTIVNNTVGANVLHGINIPENCDNNVVAGNTVTGNGGSGIYLWKADSITVLGNTVTGSGLNNIELMTSLNSSVISNTVSGSPYGVRIRSGVVSSAGNAINYNTLSANTVGIAIEGTATVKGNATLSGGVGVLVSGATTRALLENNSLINDTVAGIKVELGALVDAGDCTGGNVTGLGTGSGIAGSSAGGNTLTGYSVSVPAILNANTGGTPAVLGYQNAYGITAGTSLASVLSGNVLASQSGGLLVTPTLPPITVECVGDVPAAVNALAAFEGLGGAVSATVSVTVSSADGALTPGPTEGTITRTYTLTDVCGQTATSTQLITVNDTIAPLAGAGSVAVCYTTVAAAEAAAIAATTVSDNCTATPSITRTASTAGLDPAVITVTVGDLGGNSTTVSYTTRIDATAPVIDSTTATQFAANVKNGATTVLQGTSANAVQITVVASDTHLVVPPIVALVNGASNEVAVFDSEGPAGTFHYHWDVTPATANGTWTATVTASDLCNDTTSVFTLALNKTEIAGTVQLEGFVGNVTTRSRTVTFVATTNSPTVTNVVATWSVTLTNLSGDEFAYRLTGVPAGTTGLSAKTDWHLRRRLSAALDVNGQAVVNFSGIGGFLKAGDIAHTGVSENAVALDDYSTLVGFWFGSAPVADINGDGIVNVFDYALLSFNWYMSGDPQ